MTLEKNHAETTLRIIMVMSGVNRKSSQCIRSKDEASSGTSHRGSLQQASTNSRFRYTPTNMYYSLQIQLPRRLVNVISFPEGTNPSTFNKFVGLEPMLLTVPLIVEPSLQLSLSFCRS